MCPLISMPLALLSLQRDRPGWQVAWTGLSSPSLRKGLFVTKVRNNEDPLSMLSLSTIYHVKQPLLTCHRYTDSGYGTLTQKSTSLFFLVSLTISFSLSLKQLMTSMIPSWQLCLWQWGSQNNSLNWKKQLQLSALQDQIITGYE